MLREDFLEDFVEKDLFFFVIFKESEMNKFYLIIVSLIFDCWRLV